MPVAAQYGADVKNALTQAPFGAALVDREGVIHWTNPALATMLGEAAHESIVHSLLHIRLSPEEGEIWRSMLADHFATPPNARQPRNARFDLGSAYGIIQTVELTLVSCAGHNPDFALIYIQSLTRQIVAERRFEQIFESLPIGLLIIDQQQRIVKANTRLGADFGYRPQELVGQPLTQLLPKRIEKKHTEHVRNYCATPTTRVMGAGRDLSGLHRSGLEFPVEIALTQLENLRLPLVMALVTDITKRKRSEASLQQINAQLEEFTYVASHDLRSPLRGIADLVSWIREDLEDTQLSHEVQNNFERITLRIHRAERMIDDLLSYALAGTHNAEIETITPEELLNEAIGDVVIPKSFQLDVDIKSGPIIGPKAPLEASLRNLIANAVKHHGSESGRIRIQVYDKGIHTIFTVEDAGQGIPVGSEERIFKLFQRGSTTTDGYGVGLAFTRRMITAHGGSITVVGHDTLGGASFTINWPRIMLRGNSDE